MNKQYKVIRVTSNWTQEKLREKVEDTLNKYAKEDWDITDISYIANMNTAMITLFK